jgi:hypothetical protein
VAGAREDRAERDSDIILRVRPLNLIRIMPAEEECAIRPPSSRAAFFIFKRFRVQRFIVQRFTASGTGLICICFFG